MRLRIAAIATVLALPAAAATATAPPSPARAPVPAAAPTKDGAVRPAAPVAKNDCKTPRKARKSSRETTRS